MPAETALMLVTAHADDEGIFFGGAIPYYSRVLKVPVVLLCLTHDGHDGRSRELREACIEYGLSTPPLFGGFGDHGHIGDAESRWDLWGGKERVTTYVARKIREHRPAVLLCHDIDGEYGHPDHKVAAQAALRGAELAARPDAFPEQLESLEPWRVVKCYVHMWPHNRLWHSWDEPSPELDGRTPREIANMGLACHRSQPEYTRFVNGKDGKYGEWPAEQWGLYSTLVGPDLDPRGGFLQNVDLPMPSRSRQSPENGLSGWLAVDAERVADHRVHRNEQGPSE